MNKNLVFRGFALFLVVFVGFNVFMLLPYYKEDSAPQPSEDPPKPVLIFLAKKLSEDIVNRAEALRENGVNAFICLHSQNNLHPMARREQDLIIWQPNEPLQEKGWVNLLSSVYKQNHQKRASLSVTSWERALFWAHEQKLPHVWFVEDDVWWANSSAVAEMVRHYTDDDTDLVTRSHRVCKAENKEDWPLWGEGKGILTEEELCKTYNVICRLSLRLLQRVDDFARQHNTLLFHEVLLASLSQRHGYTARKLDYPGVNVRYRPTFGLEELQKGMGSGQFLFHPVKMYLND
ncbi:hypothetical protein QOT17_014520 [Balamuthia mandrillaris]